MFNLCRCNAATIRYSQLKFGHVHLCGMDFKCFSLHCCKCKSFGYTAAIRCGNACHGPHSDSLYSGSEHSQFNSPRLVKRGAGFPKPRRALIGSSQLWRVNDSPYYREYTGGECPPTNGAECPPLQMQLSECHHPLKCVIKLWGSAYGMKYTGDAFPQSHKSRCVPPPLKKTNSPLNELEWNMVFVFIFNILFWHQNKAESVC